MAVSRSVIYNRFDAGEYGLLGGEKPPIGSFHAKNMIVRPNGLIGPRPGLKDFTPSGMPAGLLRFIVETPTPDRELLFAIANTVYRGNFRDLTETPTALSGSLSGWGYALFPKPDTEDFLVAVPNGDGGSPAGGVFRISQVDSAVTQVPDAPAGHELEIYGSQLVVTENRGTGPRLFGSAPREGDEFTDWPSENFIDIGDNWGVRALRQQRNYLVILKRNGIYLMSGVFGDSTMTVRQVVNSQVEVVHHPWHVDIDIDDLIWLIPLFREDLETFSGAQLQDFGQYTYLQREGEDDNLPVKRGLTAFRGTLQGTDIAAVQRLADGEDRLLLRHNGIWTFHEYEKPVSGMLRSFNDHYIITDGGGVGVAAKIYRHQFTADRPAFISDQYASPGDGSNVPLDAYLHMPIWLDDKGNEVRVRAVTVEIVKYDTGVETNSLTATVTTINRPNGAGDLENEARTWTENKTAASNTGSHDRIVFPGHAHFGQGFQIKLSGIAGVDIKSITVDLEDAKTQPRKS